MRLRNWTVGAGIALATLSMAACGSINQTGLTGLEDCYNEMDDNGDGLIDCDDPQCHGHAYCLGYTELVCDNGADDDGDGDVDCVDTDCAQHPRCNPESELACADRVDNDSDGLTDCDDPDCRPTDACQEKCDDGVDNNGNGLIDCVDPQCAEAPACNREDCTNGIDDDGDGDTDCQDEDCRFGPDCTWVELCDDGDDNDYDELVDCDDPDCFDNPYCKEHQCNDSEDNDENLLVDCDDPNCIGRPGCVPNTTCQPAFTIYCNYQVMGSTEGRLNNLDNYECLSGSYPGGEQYYQLGAFPGTQITIQFTDFSNNLQLLLLTGNDGTPGCSAAGECLAAISSGGGNPAVTVAPDDYTNLYLVIDGNGTPGDYELVVNCTPLVETHCEDGTDNDYDGLIDCADPDCWLGGSCVQPAEICGDGQDNDGDGLADCADPDCQGDISCENAESACYDGLDNDGDGDTDCADSDCWTNANCTGGETSCTNDIDDDNDGAVDCWDWDCVGPTCDWWYDFDEHCFSDADCGPPDHFCVWNGPSQFGLCSKPCATPGGLDNDCETGTNLSGLCVPKSNGTGNLCILPCGSAYPLHTCPANWTCVAPDPTFPNHGVCAP